MLTTSVEGTSKVPLPLLRILVEDPELVGDDLPLPRAPVEVTVCSGPCGVDDTCPLVMDGTCPLGPFDVVVSALEGPWARAIRAAWEREPTPWVDARGVAETDAARRLAHHIGAAYQELGAGEPFCS